MRSQRLTALIFFVALTMASARCNCGSHLATCVPGESIACAGAGGCTGFQTCNSGGTFGTCVCNGPDGGVDAGGEDAGGTDAGASDAGEIDSGLADAGVADAGTRDGGASDC